MALATTRWPLCSMWRTLQLGLDDPCRAATDDIVAMWTHPDQAEGPAVFAQKREPNWQSLTPRASRD